jgi:hypothetical protein
MDYDKMSNSELEKELKITEDNFNEYKKLFQEVYTNMSELSDKYNKIKEVLDRRNGR